MNQEKINDIFLLPINNEPHVILACVENRIKVIFESELLYSFETDSGVNCIVPYTK